MDSDIELISSTIRTLSEYIPDTAAPLAVEPDDRDPEHPAPEPAPDLASTLIRARIAELQLRKHLTRRI